MKILIVSPAFWPEAFRINDLVLPLIARGHQVEILAGHPNYPSGHYFQGYSCVGPFEETYQGARVLRFPQFPRGRGRKWELILQYCSFVTLGILRLLFAGRFDWDAVFVFQSSPVTAAIPGLFASLMAGSRRVIWVQDLWPDVIKDVGINLPACLTGPVEWLSHSIYCTFDRVLTQNESMIPILHAAGVRRERITNIYNWADSGFEEPPTPPSKRTTFTVMVAGNLGRAQAIPTVLGAAKRLRSHQDIQWVILGDGPLAPYAREKVAAWGLEKTVSLPGRRPTEEMPEWYQQADVMLLSLNQGRALEHTVPSRLQGYLASMCPVIVSGNGESAKLVEKAGAGLVVPAEDEEALAQAVLTLSQMPIETRERYAKAGRTFYESHFTMRRCIENIETALH